MPRTNQRRVEKFISIDGKKNIKIIRQSDTK